MTSLKRAEIKVKVAAPKKETKLKVAPNAGKGDSKPPPDPLSRSLSSDLPQMSSQENTLIMALPVARTPGGTVILSSGDQVLLEVSPWTKQLKELITAIERRSGHV
ncbi:uncharacterized protein [Choristoneura fumiferana]|uniref:uncharacterized protein n=1 Tax=Choristoneura fumiferana TaxID=7141 RepID=UPI003D156747